MGSIKYEIKVVKINWSLGHVLKKAARFRAAFFMNDGYFLSFWYNIALRRDNGSV